jgi:FkbM family methyltransferase
MTAVEQALTRTGLYKPTRDLYQRLLNRAYFNERREGRRFYSQFVDPGDLVFDLGANRGLMSEMFLELGAKVLALEPIPDLAAKIRARYPAKGLRVEAVAVGDAIGEATLHLGADPIHSSISEEWIDRAGDVWPGRWKGTITVPVTTMDALISEHGTPEFVKIDVEMRCLTRLSLLGTYRYQFSAGETLAFMSSRWLTAPELMEVLELRRESNPVTHGDVYARNLSYSWNS